MQDTYETNSGAIDWLFEPEIYAAAPTVFITHVILEVAKENKANGFLEVCVEKKIEGAEDFVSGCFAKRNIKRNTTEKTVHFVTPMPLSGGDRLRVKFENKANGQAKVLVMWHR